MTAENVFLITDANSDPDDLACMILLSKMTQEGKINLCGVVACKGKSQTRELRARFAKAALEELGLGNVPVAVGADYQRRAGQEDDSFCFAGDVKSLLKRNVNVEAEPLQMMERVLQKHEKMTLLIISPMNDVADFIDYKPELFSKIIDKIVIMGGCKDKNGYPDEKPYNNAVCYAAAVKIWAFATEHGIPLIWMPRETVYKARVEHDFYDSLEKLPHLLAKVLLVSNKKLLEMLWEDIHCGVSSHFDVQRFIKVFVGENGGNVKAYEDFSSVWPKIRYFSLYDAIAAMVLDDDIFEKGGYLEVCPENKNVSVAKIKDADVIRSRLYEGVIGTLKEMQKEDKNV